MFNIIGLAAYRSGKLKNPNCWDGPRWWAVSRESALAGSGVVIKNAEIDSVFGINMERAQRAQNRSLWVAEQRIGESYLAVAVADTQ